MDVLTAANTLRLFRVLWVNDLSKENEHFISLLGPHIQSCPKKGGYGGVSL